MTRRAAARSWRTTARIPWLGLLPLLVAGCLPAAATREGDAIAGLYRIFVVAAIGVAAVVYGLATWTILRHRRRPGSDELPEQRHGSLRLEIAWTGIPILIVIGLFVATLPVLTRVEALTANPAVQVRVEAFRWGWRAEYPDTGVAVSGLLEPGPEIVVPVGEPLRVTLDSADVVHAFYVPVFLFKRDAIPGRETHFELTIDEPGDYGGQCAEFCGISHYRMPFTVRAVPRPEFEAWLAAQPRGTASPSPSPSVTSSP